MTVTMGGRQEAGGAGPSLSFEPGQVALTGQEQNAGDLLWL